MILGRFRPESGGKCNFYFDLKYGWGEDRASGHAGWSLRASRRPRRPGVSGGSASSGGSRREGTLVPPRRSRKSWIFEV
jgi:hypothetical protein